MLKWKNAKKIAMSTFAIALAMFTLLQPVAFATEYEDKYAKDGNIGMRDSEEYNAIYSVNNVYNTNIPIHAVLYFLVQDEDNVIMNDFVYKFQGKFSPDETYATHGFEFKLGSPIEYKEMSKVTLNGESATLFQAQFGLYPGYYSFYNDGYNYLARSSKTACFIKTMSPNFTISEPDRYTPEQWIEITENDTLPRFYAIVGEKEWIEKVEGHFEDWAIEYEAQVMGNIIDSGDKEEVEVVVPEENIGEMVEKIEEIIENQEVIIEEEEPVVFEEKLPTQPVEEESSNTFVTILIVVVVVAICILGLLFIVPFIKSKTNKY